LPRTPFEAGAALNASRGTYFPYGDRVPDPAEKRPWPLEESRLYAAGTFAHDTGWLWAVFDYQGVKDGQQVVWKVYVNGKEDYFLRRQETWALGSAGGAQKPLYFAFIQPGEYRVEMYLDGHLVQQGHFAVEEPPAVEPAPETVLEDDFSDPTSGWERVTGGDYVASYEDGAYLIAIDQAYQWGMASLGWGLVDSQIEVDATRLAGSNTGQIGLSCRRQPDRVWDGYYFLLSGDGSAGIGRQREDEWTWLVEPTPAPAVRKGNATNRLRAVCAGPFLAFYVNGEMVAHARDAAFSWGNMGLVAATGQVGVMDARFDDLVVRLP